MSFMYLKLSTGKYGIEAEVTNDGELGFSSLGTESSRITNRPDAVFKLSSFIGLEAIATNDLAEELLRRLGAEELSRRLTAELTNDQLVQLLRQRLR